MEISMFPNRISPQQAAQSLFKQLHPNADCLLLAGSIMRGEGTASSDLDLVVLYPDAQLLCAYRQSLVWERYPVELFVHSAPTLRYFFEKMDAPTGFPPLMQMVSEGLEIPGETPLSREMKQLARDVLAAGPPPLTNDQLERRRYVITDLIEDIRTPRSREELTASATQLYGELADFYFRSQKLWSAKGKVVPRKLRAQSPEFAARFIGAFEALFAAGEPQPVVSLAEEILAPHGGFLFEGYRLDAPADFRLDKS